MAQGVVGRNGNFMMNTDPTPTKRLGLRVIFHVTLRQFAWWLIMVLLVTFAGYPGVVCVTPMAWLIALRVGNQVAWRSQSGLRSQRLIEAAFAGALLGLLQGILFAVIVPLMGPIQENELANSFILISLMLGIGTLAGAGLLFITAYLNENRRGNS